MTQGVALAIISKVYLRENNIQTYDMRSFEFWNGNKCFTKLQPLILAVKFFNLSDKEMEAKKLLTQSGLNAIENDIDYTIELLKK